MRNIFDQYNQPENRLTHSLATALNQDKSLLKNFLSRFGPNDIPDVKTLQVIEQGLPGSVIVDDENEAERRGLPDMVIFNEKGWALLIESKVSSSLTKDQLQRHSRTIQKCGIDKIYGLAITVAPSPFSLTGWQMTTWKDVYSWANEHTPQSAWAKHMVEYFNIAENKMAQNEYLVEGTITEFSGINFDPYTYLEGKRVLRLLTNKIRNNKSFVREMDLDQNSKRPAITNDPWGVWDFVSFNANASSDKNFTSHPHCTFGFSDKDRHASGMITCPNAMERPLLKNLIGPSHDDFSLRLKDALSSITKNLHAVKGYKPVIRMVQRHYKSQRSSAVIDGEMTVDLRACFGGEDHHMGRPIKPQEQWLRAVYELLSNKRSNIQFQIGVVFPYDLCPELKSRNADELFINSFRALKPFIKSIMA
ncbi:MAG: hypothetical protein CO093_00370 [Alphaproteobacteria bacterium CG_4_9_14_3_um_filter_47_13]|nr:MAG: hypothetical protein CO093_00370 [Alphaproteobacteria bacterium CG_4_9_14_3_um_filter_47_13]